MKNAPGMLLRCFAGATVLVSVSGPAAASAPAAFLPGRQVGSVELAAINEASGLLASRANPGVLWVHNDSGDSARVFAMDTAGKHLGTYNVTGAVALDWEDMAVGPGPAAGQQYLYLGDIGDNFAFRPWVTVYRVPEPVVATDQTPGTFSLAGAEAMVLQYPDGPRDAETLISDPLTADLYVISKRESRSRVYRAAYPQAIGPTITMEFLGELPWGWATAGDVSPAGDEVVVRGYTGASLWERPAGSELWEAFATTAVSIPLVSEPQGETISFDADGVGYFTVSEGSYQPIYYFPRRPPGDANADGLVDEADHAIWLAHYKLSGSLDEGDFNDDGFVNGGDYTLWADNYTGAAPPAPEPAALTLLCAAAPVVLTRWWRKSRKSATTY